MYCAINPRKSNSIENMKRSNEMSVPNPAKGTPPIIQIPSSTKIDVNEIEFLLLLQFFNRSADYNVREKLI